MSNNIGHLYSGTIWHCRNKPRGHRFSYPIFMTLIDIERVDQVFRYPLVFSAKWPSLIRFRRADYHGDENQSLEDSIRDLVFTETGVRPAGKIRLLTHLRYFGFSFNPVSFYYCYEADDESIQAVVAEVSNTPWGERHCYVIPWHDVGDLAHECDKEFHVSPFMEMDMTYRWRISPPSENLGVRIECHQDSEMLFEADLALQRKSLNLLNLFKTMVRFPIIPLQILGAIYWQAFLLWCKSIPYVPHPKQGDKAAVGPTHTS